MAAMMDSYLEELDSLTDFADKGRYTVLYNVS